MPGIKVKRTKNLSPTAVVVTSTTVIGIVGTVCIEKTLAELNAEKALEGVSKDRVVEITSEISSLETIKAKLADKTKAGLIRYSNALQAMEAFEECEGTLRETLHDIYCQNVYSPIVLSLIQITAEQAEKSHLTFYDTPAIKSEVLEKLNALKMAKTVLGTKVRIPLVENFTHDETVLNAVGSYTDGTNTISVASANHSAIDTALVQLAELASDRYLITPFYRRVWSIFQDKYIEKPYGAIVAGHIAKWDAEGGEFGTCYDHANRPIFNMGDCLVPLFYEEGEDTCDVNILVNAGACLCINDDVTGDCLYNFETPINTSDTRFGKLETRRAFDLANEELQKKLKTHKHRTLTSVLDLAKADAEAFLLKGKKAGAFVGYEVTWSAQNSSTDISAGILYLDYKAGNNLGVRTIVLQGYATSEYYTVEV